MNWITGAWATCLFELKRSFILQRIAVAAILTAFPPVMILFSLGSGGLPAQSLDFFLILLVALVTVLSLLLWATPIVYSEIESKAWVFLASRPRGRISIYIGKYLSAVIFTSSITTLSILLSLLVASSLGYDYENPFLAFLKFATIFFLASAGYGAVFAFIGTLIFKRAMVISAAYMLIWEGVIATLPAIVNQLTLRWHLQSVAIEWIGFFVADNEFKLEDYRMVYGMGPNIWINLPAIFVAVAIFLGLGCFIITARQYSVSDEV